MAMMLCLSDSFPENVCIKSGIPTWFVARPYTNRLRSHRPSLGNPFVIAIEEQLKSGSQSP